jgi:hypothetical protein
MAIVSILAGKSFNNLIDRLFSRKKPEIEVRNPSPLYLDIAPDPALLM